MAEPQVIIPSVSSQRIRKLDGDKLQTGRRRTSSGSELTRFIPSEEWRVVEHHFDTGNEKMKKTEKFSLLQKKVFCSLILLNVTTYASSSIIAPLFPHEALEKNVPLFVSGLVFSAFSLTVFLASPFIGNVIQRFGPKSVLLIGAFTCGLSNILFGFLGEIKSGHIFIICCFVTRAIEAMSSAAYSVATYTFASKIFPASISCVIGMMETASNIGLSVGPAIGGNLYEFGGYGLPFFVLGGFLMFTLPINCYLLPKTVKHHSSNDNDDNSTTITLREMLGVTPILANAFILLLAGNAWSSINATLSLQLSEQGLSGGELGLFYFVASSIYAIAATCWGYVADRIKTRTWILMVSGLASSSVGFALLGHVLVPNFERSLTLTCIGMVVLTVSVSAAVIPSFANTIQFAAEAGYPEDVKLFAVLSSLSWSIYSFGGVTGPAIGAFLTDKFGFEVSCAVMGLSCLITAFFVILYFIRRAARVESKEIRYYPNGATESTPLFRKESYRGHRTSLSDTF